eukprot:1635674-Prymnesium_polylepis.1
MCCRGVCTVEVEQSHLSPRVCVAVVWDTVAAIVAAIVVAIVAAIVVWDTVAATNWRPLATAGDQWSPVQGRVRWRPLATAGDRWR